MRTESKLLGYAAAVCGVLLVVAVLLPLRNATNPTTVALALLVVVLLVATRFGMAPAVVAATGGMLVFNFFFLPPYHTFTIADPENWVALAVFVVTAVTAGQLSATARRRADEAESGRREIERLYGELRDAFDRASRAEALRQAERMKSALLDAVTHDLRTPLTAIKVSVTNLLDEARGTTEEDEAPVRFDPSGRQELLEVIDEESDRLDRYVANLLELAKLEAGQLELRRRPTSVAEIVAHGLERADRYVRSHRVVAAIDEDTPLVLADGNALAEVIHTLVENAAKYSPPGSRIGIAAETDERGNVLLAIEDEGRGIPSSLRDRVFHRFFRIQSSGEPSPEQPAGTGLGLAIARELVEAHGGRIWIDETPRAVGTRVNLLLPGVDADEGDAPGLPAASGAEFDRS